MSSTNGLSDEQIDNIIANLDEKSLTDEAAKLIGRDKNAATPSSVPTETPPAPSSVANETPPAPSSVATETPPVPSSVAPSSTTPKLGGRTYKRKGGRKHRRKTHKKKKRKSHKKRQ